MGERRYTLRLGSEIYIPAVDWRPECRILISPLKWHEVDYQGAEPVLWAVSYLREMAEVPFGEAMDGPHLEAARLSEWPGEDLRVDYAKFEGSWTEGEVAEILAAFPAY